MSSGFVNEQPADHDIGRFFREVDPGNFPEPCDPPDAGPEGNELPGEEIIEDYDEPPAE